MRSLSVVVLYLSRFVLCIRIMCVILFRSSCVLCCLGGRSVVVSSVGGVVFVVGSCICRCVV